MLKLRIFFPYCVATALMLFSCAVISQTPSVATTTTATTTTTTKVATPTVSLAQPAVPASAAASEPKPFSNFIPTLTRKPTNTLTATPSVSAASSTTATQKAANTGEIFRWIDSKGKVQYSADVPEDRRSTARKLDTRGNVVSSSAPASPQALPQPLRSITPVQSAQSPASDALRSAKKPVTEREKCEAAWQAYQAAQQCFAQNRQGIVGGPAGRPGSVISAQGQQICSDLPEPAPCR